MQWLVPFTSHDGSSGQRFRLGGLFDPLVGVPQERRWSHSTEFIFWPAIALLFASSKILLETIMDPQSQHYQDQVVDFDHRLPNLLIRLSHLNLLHEILQEHWQFLLLLFNRLLFFIVSIIVQVSKVGLPLIKQCQSKHFRPEATN